LAGLAGAGWAGWGWLCWLGLAEAGWGWLGLAGVGWIGLKSDHSSKYMFHLHIKPCFSMNSTQLDGGTLQPKIFEISLKTNKN
jgi:hypothetical protein